MGTAHVAAHQIALQLWTFLALVMDSVAIAAQQLIGGLLGAGERDDARSTARRLAEIGTVLGLVFAVLLTAGWNIIPELFTDELPVVDQAHVAWPWFIATLPLSGCCSRSTAS